MTLVNLSPDPLDPVWVNREQITTIELDRIASGSWFWKRERFFIVINLSVTPWNALVGPPEGSYATLDEAIVAVNALAARISREAP
jgi:hypothetical protein